MKTPLPLRVAGVLAQLLGEMFLGIRRRHLEHPPGCDCHPAYHDLGVHAPTQGAS